MTGMCAPESLKHITLCIGCFQILVACYMVSFTLAVDSRELAELIPEYQNYVWILWGLTAGIILAMVVLFMIPVQEGSVFSRTNKCGLVVLIIVAIWGFIIGGYLKQLRCQYILPHSFFYDNVVMQTGTRNLFCTAACPCELPGDDRTFQFRWEDIRRSPAPTHDRILVEGANAAFLQTSLLDCNFSREDDLQRYLKLEQQYFCSGWCHRANMQTLNNSLKPVINANLSGHSCYEASRSLIEQKEAKLRPYWMGVIGLLGIQLIVEALADKLTRDDKDKEE